MNERLNKQELKNDPLMKHTGEVVDFAQHHVRLLLGSAAILLIAVIATVFIRASGARADDRAAGMMAEARADLAKGNPQAAAARLHDLLEFHGGTTSGKQALLMNADIQFDLGRYDEALTYYQRSLDAFGGDPVLGRAARRGLAATHENLGNNAKAAEILEELRGGATDPVLKAEIGLDLARNYLKLQRDADAERIYEEVSRNQDDARAAQEAKQSLAELRTLRTAR